MRLHRPPAEEHIPAPVMNETSQSQSGNVVMVVSVTNEKPRTRAGLYSDEVKLAISGARIERQSNTERLLSRRAL
jgi:hypothetical protein